MPGSFHLQFVVRFLASLPNTEIAAITSNGQPLAFGRLIQRSDAVVSTRHTQGQNYATQIYRLSTLF